MSTLEDTLAKRGTTHGDFKDNSAISQVIKLLLRKSKQWDNLSSVQQEALDMIVHKIARIVSGNPNHSDSWHDIAGYARLAEKDIINEKTNE